MGVPRLYPYIQRRFPDAIRRVRLGTSDFTTDYLCIDANAIIHKACQTVYCYGQYGQDMLSSSNENQTWKATFEFIMNEIKRIATVATPRMGIFISFDGVAPRGKEKQQRHRRYRTISDTPSNFNSNVISVGTEYIEEMTKYMYFAIRKEIHTNPDWKFLKVWFSPSTVPGEGEHKIMRFIRKSDRSRTFTVVGNDGDLIVLIIAVGSEKIFLLREEIDFGLYSIVNMSKVKIPDCPSFVINSFFAGNDFFQITPMFRDVVDALNFYWEESPWKKAVPVTQQLKTVIDSMASVEPERLEAIARNTFTKSLDDKFRNNLLCDYFSETLDFEGYREAYNKRFPDIQKVCLDYIKTLFWNFQYYTGKDVCWTWAFEHDYSPLMADLKKYFPDSVESLAVFEPTFPHPPFLQLLNILPPQSKSLLPAEIQPIVVENPDLFPAEFSLDFKGKTRDYQAVVLIPKVETERIKEIYEKKKHLLEIYSRNESTRECYFMFVPDYTCRFESPYGEILDLHVKKTSC